MTRTNPKVYAEFTGDGVQTEFPAGFYAEDITQIVLEVDDPGTFSWTAKDFYKEEGVTVVVNPAPPSGSTVKIYRATSPIQAVDFTNYTTVSPEELENALDALTDSLQEAHYWSTNPLPTINTSNTGPGSSGSTSTTASGFSTLELGEGSIEPEFFGGRSAKTFLGNASDDYDLPKFMGAKEARGILFGVETDAGLIHIQDGSPTNGPINTGANLIVEDDGGTTGIQLISTDGGLGAIYFGDQSRAAAGWIRYEYDSADSTKDALSLRVNQAEIVSISWDAGLTFSRAADVAIRAKQSIEISADYDADNADVDSEIRFLSDGVQIAKFSPSEFTLDTNLVSFDVTSNATIQAKRSLVLEADYDNNSGSSDSTIIFRADGSDVAKITKDGNFIIGTAKGSGGGDVGRIGYTGDMFYLAPLNSGATATDYGAQIKYDPALGYWQAETHFDATALRVNGVKVIGDQQAAIADISSAATSGTLPAADGSVTIADAAAPTNAELLEYCVELETKLEAALAALRAHGLIAT